MFAHSLVDRVVHAAPYRKVKVGAVTIAELKIVFRIVRLSISMKLHMRQTVFAPNAHVVNVLLSVERRCLISAQKSVHQKVSTTFFDQPEHGVRPFHLSRIAESDSAPFVAKLGRYGETNFIGRRQKVPLRSIVARVSAAVGRMLPFTCHFKRKHFINLVKRNFICRSIRQKKMRTKTK